MTLTSPMSTPNVFDRLVLVYTGGRVVLPGVPMVKVTRETRDEALQTAGVSGEVVSHYGDDTATITVDFTFWSAEQYREFVALLKVLRIRAGQKPQVYAVVHPILQAHGIRKARFVKLKDDGHSAMNGYKVQLEFTEFYAPKSGNVVPVASEADTSTAVGVSPDTQTALAAQAAGRKLTAAQYVAGIKNAGPKGKAVFQSALQFLVDGKGVSTPGNCSAWAGEVYQAAFPGAGRALFATTNAKDTSALFAKAGLAKTFNEVGYSGLKAGDLVFYDQDRSGQGHVGVYDGRGGVVGNNLVTYRQNGGQFAGGVATGYDKTGKAVDARGVQPIDSLGTPTRVGRLDGFPVGSTRPAFIGPTQPGIRAPEPVITPPSVPKKV